ncbi:hypothetical protein GCM10020331_027950 [Ectobacillus funiculus]
MEQQSSFFRYYGVEGREMGKMKKVTYVKFAIDIVMAVVFVLLFNKQVLGGMTFHEIAGLAIAAIFFLRMYCLMHSG